MTCTQTYEKDVQLRNGSNTHSLKPKYRVWISLNKTEYFTSNGDYYDGFHYFQTSEYCVKSVSSDKMTLRICAPTCNSTEPHLKYCIPKCCAPDEVLNYWSFRCRKIRLNETGWKPELWVVGNSTIVEPNELIHFTSHELSCENAMIRNPLTTVIYDKDGEYDIDIKQNIRMDISQGRLNLLKLEENRKWEKHEIPFCIDGFIENKNQVYFSDPNDVIVLTCAPDDAKFYNVAIVAWATIIILAIGSIFLLMVVMIHLILLKQLNFNALCILSYSMSLLCSYSLHTIAHLITINPNREFTGLGSRGFFCMAISVGCHYFLITSELWLALLNFELWRTLRSTMHIDPTSKRLKAFCTYSLIGWGIPLILIALFVTVDEVYRDPLTYVVVPDYAMQSCSVAVWSRGYYVYTPKAIILFANGILIILTVKVIAGARKNASAMTTSKQHTYSATLFIKLFGIMGIFWFIRMIVWYFDDGTALPWYIVVLQSIMLLQPIPLFVLFCCNKRTKDKLAAKFPKIFMCFEQGKFMITSKSRTEGINQSNTASTSL
ncbi:G-protein coupled receptor Mth2 [Orchesella cincta]|uniref:G-protein coupled receptor Mth2 n=1 Tax=Orchesella cincta TaxID=48709 RepID=A0A1D2MF96_ORCCI|nr:G-protein coupled receptor Mth2 [Orchesella cincta]